MQFNINRLKIIGGLVFILFVIFFLSQYSIIKVNLPNEVSGNYTYKILNQSDNTSSTVNTAKTKLSKIVTKGSYEIYIKKDNRSYFDVVSTHGFFTTTKVTGKLSTEKSRSFIGDNPGSCMFYDQKLFSFECGNLFSSISIHQPGTETDPPYVSKVTNSSIDGLVEGVIKTPEGTIAILHPSGDEGSSVHTAYILDSGLNVISSSVLEGLDGGVDYSVKNFKSGFILYDRGFSNIKFFESSKSKPQTINLVQPINDKLSPQFINTDGGSIVAGYAAGLNQDANDVKTTVKITDNEVYVKNDKGQSHIRVSSAAFTNAGMCGQDLLCTLSGDEMSVYKLNQNKAKYLYKVNKVDSFYRLGDREIIVRSSEILSFDISNRIGYTSYSYGDYKYCGLTVDSSNYLLCLVNNSKRLGVYINQASDDTFSIDKKVLSLQKLSSIGDVSVYGNYVYVSPNLGGLVFNSSTKTFDYDPVTKSRVANAINNDVSRLGFDKTPYKVINIVP